MQRSGKNVIFDMGNVLLKYDPELFLDREGVTEKEDREQLLREIFRSPDWPAMDAGDLKEEELERKVRKILPERLHAVAHRLIFGWDDPVEAMPGMADFVRECKERGYGIYLLSNASFRQPEYWHRVPGSEYFDGTVISAYEHVMKPDPAIYHILLNRFGLKAEDCWFIDDHLPNVEAACREGIRGIRFQGNVEELRGLICPQE